MFYNPRGDFWGFTYISAPPVSEFLELIVRWWVDSLILWKTDRWFVSTFRVVKILLCVLSHLNVYAELFMCCWFVTIVVQYLISIIWQPSSENCTIPRASTWTAYLHFEVNHNYHRVWDKCAIAHIDLPQHVRTKLTRWITKQLKQSSSCEN